MCFGGLFGFLFGVPRTPGQQSGASPAKNQTGAEANKDDAAAKVAAAQNKTRPNTNLEEISDWLTKILVGAGLTQLNKIPGKLGQLSAFIAKGMGSDTGPNEAFAAATIVFFSICGFLAVFLWTRMYLPELLDRGILGSLIQKDAEQQQKIDQNRQKIDENVNNIKEFLTRKIGEATANPLASEQERLNKAKPELEAATRFVESRDEKDFTPTDYMVLAYDAYHKKDYKTAAEKVEKSINLNPAKETLSKTYNVLGLCYHYQEPKDWKPGDDTYWLDNAIKNYQAAIANKNSLQEELLAKANLSFVYLDAEQYDDCMRTAAEVLAKESQGDEQVVSTCNLARIADAAAKAMKNDIAGATNALNSVKNIASFGYLFNPDDLPVAALKVFAKLTGLNPEVKAFVDKVAMALKL